MTYYNLSEFENGGNAAQLAQAANDASGGVLFPGLVLVGLIVLYTAMVSRGNEKIDSLVASSFISMVISIFLSFIDLVAPLFMIFMIVPTVLLIIYFLLKPRYN